MSTIPHSTSNTSSGKTTMFHPSYNTHQSRINITKESECDTLSGCLDLWFLTGASTALGMAEVKSNGKISRSELTTNEGTINELATTPRASAVCDPTIPMDLLLCDYVKLRKMRTDGRGAKKTKTDKKLQVSPCL